MGYAFLEYGFPVYLIVVEAISRFFVNTEASAFIGPALATGGLGTLMSLVKPKQPRALDPAVEDAVRKAGGRVVLQADQTLIAIVWGFVLIGFVVWLWSCHESSVDPNGKFWYFIPNHVGIGSINYLVAVICVAIKAKL